MGLGGSWALVDESIESYVTQTLKLLDLERSAEIAESERLAQLLTPQELQRRGRCLLRLQILDTFSGLRGRMHLKLGIDRDTPLPAHRMGPGDVVSIQASGNSGGEAPTGVVVRVRRDAVTVALDREPETEIEGRIRLDKVANDVTYRRLQRGLGRLATYERGRASKLRKICFGIREPDSAAVRELDFTDPSLNESQRTAVAASLFAPEVALIHGPPGTGKTTAVAELIRQAVAQRETVLACAGSNVAVDNLAEKLAGLRIVRLGHPARLLPAVVENSLDAWIERSEGTQLIKELRRDVEVCLKRLVRAADYSTRKKYRTELRYLREGIREVESATVRQILSGADVILTTNVGAGARRLENLEFDLVVIDEAAQALECSCWIPLLKGSRAVLAGDHLQLPPTVHCREAERAGLNITLFERLAAMYPHQCHLLEVQYRMHKTIMRWSSDALYDGRIQAHESVREHRLQDLPHVSDGPDTEVPFLFIDTAGYDATEAVDEHQESRWNVGEGRLVRAHVRQLLAAGVAPGEIAVITPYNAQVDHLRRTLDGLEPGIEIDTVDGFQGREKEAVVLSLVRSNDRGEIGFLSDERRLNVAITRARRHVAVIGDSATISNSAFLAQLVEYMNEHAQYRSAYEIVLD